MLCLNCGKSLGDSSTSGYCENCKLKPSDSSLDKLDKKDSQSKNKVVGDNTKSDSSDDSKQLDRSLENIRFATFLDRLVAKVVDYTIVIAMSVPFIILGFFLLTKYLEDSLVGNKESIYTIFFEAGTAFALTCVISQIIDFFYYPLFEGGMYAATPGKRLVGIEVKIANDLFPPTYGKAFMRQFVRLLCMGSSFISFFFNSKNQAMHDLATGTIVVKNEDKGTSYLSSLLIGAFVLNLAISGGLEYATSFISKNKGAQNTQKLEQRINLQKQIDLSIKPQVQQINSTSVPTPSVLKVVDPTKLKVELNRQFLEVPKIDGVIGEVTLGKQQFNVKDFVSYRFERSFGIALFFEKLSISEKEKLLSSKSLFTRINGVPPPMVITLELNVNQKLENGVMYLANNPFGGFSLGMGNNASIKLTSKDHSNWELSDRNFTFQSEGDKNLENFNLGFSWNLAGKITVKQ